MLHPPANVVSLQPHWLCSDSLGQWDAFVESHPLGLIYHLSAWKDSIEEVFPHIKGKILVLRDSDSGCILAGLPIYTVRSWLLGDRLVSVPFASICDPLVTTEAQFALLWPSLESLRCQQSCKHIEIRALAARAALQHPQLALTFPFKHHRIDLKTDTASLFESLSKTAVRHMIRKAEKLPIQVFSGVADADLVSFYDLYHQTRRRLSLPCQPFALFQALKGNLGEHRFRLRLARFENRVIAGLIVLSYKDLCIVEFATDRPEYRKTGVNQLLYWHAIKEAASSGFTRFSLGRTSLANTGLLEYKRHWATAEEPMTVGFYPAVAHAKTGNREQSLVHTFSKAAFARSPAFLYDLLSHFCYRHLG